MTKAKRYEGERLRAEQWHNMGRDKAWEAQRKGEPELRRIVHGKFDVYCRAIYDHNDCGYLIVTELTYMKPPVVTNAARSHKPEDLVMVHEEPCFEFPSDHLKTKLLLLVG